MRDSINKVIVAFTATNPKDVHFTGLMVGYHDHPVALIDTGDGTQSPWAAHLCREAMPDEAIAYWRNRAEKAEAAIATPHPKEGGKE